MLTSSLIQIFNVICHHWCSNGFPCFFNYKAFSTFLDTHLLCKHVHDDKGQDREENRIILHLVYLKDNELFIEQRTINIIIQNAFILTTFVEGLENCCKVMDVELNILLFHYLRNTLYCKLIVRIETEFCNFQLLFLTLYLIYLMLYTHKIFVLDNFWSKTLQSSLSNFLLAFSSCFVFDYCFQLF